MAVHHVADLDLRVVGEDDATVGEQAERWVRALWEAVGESLERAHPGRVFRVRSWQGRWQLALDELAGPPPPTLVAEIAAECRRASLLAVRDAPAASVDVASWPDEPTRVAGWCAAGGGRHWAWADLRDVGSIGAVLRGLGPEGAWVVLERLDDAEVIELVLARMAEYELRSLSEWLSPGAAVVGLRPPGTVVDGTPVGQAAAAVAALVEAVRRRRGASSVPPPPVVAAAPPGSRDVTSVPADAPNANGAAVPSAQHDRPADVGSAVSASASEEPSGAATASPPGTAAATEWGGLVYLVRPMLECGLGEVLWEACLPEAVVLRDAFTALCGPDPAVAALTGAADGELPAVDVEQVAEVRRVLFGRWRTAAARRAAGDVALSVSVGSRGLLLLHGAGAPWACAAWSTDDNAARAEAASLAGALVPADRGVEPWTATEPDAVTSALLTMAVGAPALLLATRVGAVEPRWLRRPARIEDDGDTLWFHFSGDAVDLALRRAGADADPGWVPWLQRHVRLTYAVGSGD